MVNIANYADFLAWSGSVPATLTQNIIVTTAPDSYVAKTLSSSLNGNGKTISLSDQSEMVGLFIVAGGSVDKLVFDGNGVATRKDHGYLMSTNSNQTGTFTNISFINANIGENGGAICGSSQPGTGTLTINNISFSGSIGTSGGGLVGKSCGTTGVSKIQISKSCVSASMIGINAGGLAGQGSAVTVDRCFFIGTLISGCGGIVGFNDLGSVISNSYSYPSSTDFAAFFPGAIVGPSPLGTVSATNCYYLAPSGSSGLLKFVGGSFSSSGSVNVFNCAAPTDSFGVSVSTTNSITGFGIASSTSTSSIPFSGWSGSVWSGLNQASPNLQLIDFTLNYWTGYSGFGVAPHLDFSLPCLLAGTRIMTTRGEKLIEHLTLDDELTTPTGKTRIVKIYSQEIVTDENTTPFLLGDLHLSRHHAFWLDESWHHPPCYGLQQNIELLGQKVKYFHLRTENYADDLILANGNWVETYADDQTARYSWSCQKEKCTWSMSC